MYDEERRWPPSFFTDDGAKIVEKVEENKRFTLSSFLASFLSVEKYDLRNCIRTFEVPKVKLDSENSKGNSQKQTFRQFFYIPRAVLQGKWRVITWMTYVTSESKQKSVAL